MQDVVRPNISHEGLYRPSIKIRSRFILTAQILKMCCVAREGSPPNKGRGVVLIKTGTTLSILAVFKYKNQNPD